MNSRFPFNLTSLVMIPSREIFLKKNVIERRFTVKDQARCRSVFFRSRMSSTVITAELIVQVIG